jgi:hypothetical protein
LVEFGGGVAGAEVVFPAAQQRVQARDHHANLIFA